MYYRTYAAPYASTQEWIKKFPLCTRWISILACKKNYFSIFFGSSINSWFFCSFISLLLSFNWILIQFSDLLFMIVMLWMSNIRFISRTWFNFFYYYFIMLMYVHTVWIYQNLCFVHFNFLCFYFVKKSVKRC
jgi:hypothetical protein